MAYLFFYMVMVFPVKHICINIANKNQPILGLFLWNLPWSNIANGYQICCLRNELLWTLQWNLHNRVHQRSKYWKLNIMRAIHSISSQCKYNNNNWSVISCRWSKRWVRLDPANEHCVLPGNKTIWTLQMLF